MPKTFSMQRNIMLLAFIKYPHSLQPYVNLQGRLLLLIYTFLLSYSSIITDGKGGKSSDVIHVPRNVRRDGVDERCKRDNIKYLKWVGKKGRGLHRSQVSTKKVLIDYVPKAQDVNADCILCPMEKTLDGKADAIDHYKRVHIAHLLTINNTNMLRCRCSEIRSRGSDNSVRNRHYHCIECWHPFDTGAKIRIHMLSKHSDKYSGSQLAHLKPRSQRN